MSYSKQELNGYISTLETRVSEAKQNGNRPEAARCQKAINDLREYLQQHPGGGDGPLPVNLQKLGLNGHDEPSGGEPPWDDGQRALLDMMKAYEQKEYRDCVELAGKIPQTSPVYRNAHQLAQHAGTILDLQDAVAEAEELSRKQQWKAAARKLQESLEIIEQPSDPRPEVNAARSQAEGLLKSLSDKTDHLVSTPEMAEKPVQQEEVKPVANQVLPEESKPQPELAPDKKDAGFAKQSTEKKEAPNQKGLEIGVVEKQKTQTYTGSLRSEKTGEIENLMREAQIAFDAKHYSRAKTRLAAVLQSDENHQQAKALLQKVDVKYQEQKQQEEIDALSKEIVDTEDILALENLVSRLATLQSEQPENHEIRKASQQVRAKYDQKRREQGSGTTADAVKNYNVVVETLQKIDDEINKGGQNWFDDRMGKTRPIYEVRDELTESLPDLASEVYKKYTSRATGFLPHDPKSALVYFEKAYELDLQNEEEQAEVEKNLIETKQRIEQWDKADALLIQADRLEDSFAKYKTIEDARLAYSGHPKIKAYHADISERVANILIGVVQRAVDEAESLLLKEEFSQARSLLAGALKETEILVSPTEALNKKKKAADDLLDRIQERENRRAGIQEKAKQIRKEVEQKNFNFAAKIYAGLTPDQQKDPDISSLRASFQHAIDHDAQLKEAQGHFAASNWAECIALCRLIGEEGVIGATVRALRLQAEINLHKADFDAAYREEYYDQADCVLQTLFSMPDLPSDQRNALLEDYADQKTEMERRKSKDPAISGKLSDAERAIQQEQWLTAYDLLLDTLRVDSSQVGNIREKLKEIEPRLHTMLIKDLQEALAVEDYARAFAKAEVLNKRNLFWNEDERLLRQKAVTEHYRRMTADLEKDNAWEQIIAAWQQAVDEFASDLAIREELRQTRRKKLIFDCDRNLQDLNYGAVLQSIRASMIELQDDPELQAQYTAAEILQEADALIARKEYVGMMEFIGLQMEELGRPEFEKYLEKKTKEIVQGLLESGDACIQDGRIADALGEFTIALNMAPDNITAKGRLQSRLPEVRSELHHLLDAAEDFGPGSEAVADKLKNGAALLADLKNFRSVVGWLDRDNDQNQRNLNRNIAEMEEKLADLEKARKILERNDETSQTWRAMLRQGIWTQLDEDLRALAVLITPRHPQYMELEGRKRRSVEQRKRLNDALENMKTAFDEEDFDKAMQCVGDALQINKQIVRTDNPDPYGLLAQHASIYHIYSKEQIVGLENILDLLEAQKEDFGNWDRWYVRVDKLLKDIDRSWNEIEMHWEKDSRGRFDISQPTKKGVATLENCVHLHEDVLKVYEEEMPSSGPESGKAKQLQREMQNLHEEMLKSQDEITDLHRLYKESSHAIDLTEITTQAEDLIQQQAFGEALDWISQGLEYDPSNEFLNYLNDVCQQNLGRKPGGIFGGIFGKKN